MTWSVESGAINQLTIHEGMTGQEVDGKAVEQFVQLASKIGCMVEGKLFTILLSAGISNNHPSLVFLRRMAVLFTNANDMTRRAMLECVPCNGDAPKDYEGMFEEIAKKIVK